MPRQPRALAAILAIAVCGCLAQSSPRPARPAAEDRVDVDVDVVRELEDLAAAEAMVKKPRHTTRDTVGVVDTSQATKMCSRGRCPNGFRCGVAPGRPRKVCYASNEKHNGPTKMFEVTPGR